MLSLLVCVMLFHLSIILKMVPYEITWGGRLKSDAEMYVFETISMLINLLLFSILLIKGGFVKEFISLKAVSIILWIFMVLFGLNTIGNLFADTILEKCFAVLTFAFVILIWTILKRGNKRVHNNV